MPSGTFSSCPLDFIAIPPRQRQRPNFLAGLDRLADSISRLGLLHPIVITREHVLIAGERRLEACRSLGWTNIPFQYADETDPRLLKCMELEENTRRKDLTWQEINDAMAEAYAIYKELEPEATQTQIAERMGEDQGNLSAHLLVKEERARNPALSREDTFRTARDRSQAAVKRRAADEDMNINGPSMNGYTPSVLCENFFSWAPQYSGPKFNLLHCDFPYGIDSQNSAQNASGYDDSMTVYMELMKCLAVNLDNFCTPSAHMIFWFSPGRYSLVWENLKLLDGFVWDEVPLVWFKSDNAGIIPDLRHRPRRVYETAFFGWRGGRELLRVRANTFAAPTERQRHPHEKSEEALRHFFSMCVDSTTRLLDPTCGSGSALRAAKSLGASTVLGLERDAGYADEARRSLSGGGIGLRDGQVDS
jgi:ParB family chromosome partitioning protein